jgi:hypothetical protein
VKRNRPSARTTPEESGHEINERPAPAIEPPYDDKINFAPPCRSEKILAFLPERRSRTDILHLEGDLPPVSGRSRASRSPAERHLYADTVGDGHSSGTRAACKPAIRGSRLPAGSRLLVFYSSRTASRGIAITVSGSCRLFSPIALRPFLLHNSLSSVLGSITQT